MYYITILYDYGKNNYIFNIIISALVVHSVQHIISGNRRIRIEKLQQYQNIEYSYHIPLYYVKHYNANFRENMVIDLKYYYYDIVTLKQGFFLR